MKNGFYKYKDNIIYLCEIENKLVFIREDISATQIATSLVKINIDNTILFKESGQIFDLIPIEMNEQSKKELFNFMKPLSEFFKKHIIDKQREKVEKELQKLKKYEMHQSFLDEASILADSPIAINYYNEEKASLSSLIGNNSYGLKDIGTVFDLNINK